METPCCYPSEQQQHHGRKSTETYVTEFCISATLSLIHHYQNAYMKRKTAFDAIRSIDVLLEFIVRNKIECLKVAFAISAAAVFQINRVNWINGLNAEENRVFSKERRGAYVCTTFIEGATLSSI